MKKNLILFLLIANQVFAAEPSNFGNAQHMINQAKWAFEENKGQVKGEDGSKVKYWYQQGNVSMFLMKTGIAYQFNNIHYPDGYKPLVKFATPEERAQLETLQKQIRTETYRMDVNLVGANPNAFVGAEGKSEDYIQYYNHNVLDVHSYKKVTYYEVYPNIDWVVYINDKAQANEPKVKYDFVVHPGGDPSQIKLQTNWVEELKLNQDGSMSLINRMGSVTEKRPISYQGNQAIETNFDIKDGIIKFQIDNYLSNQDLIIDPAVIWGTYYGQWGTDFAGNTQVDNFGNIYLSGSTSSVSLIASGGYQNTFGGGYDLFLVKFNSAGARQWATYYGGSANEEGRFCHLDGLGNIYLVGYTISTSGIASGGHQNTIGGGYDGLLVKFNSAGVRQWATYCGGTNDDYAYECTTDKNGHIYLVGYTQSTNAIAGGGYKNHLSGLSDALLIKYDGNGTKLWGTYYGGSNQDFGVSVGVDTNNNVFLGGISYSTDSVSFLGHQNIFGGGSNDCFITKFNNSGIPIWSTYYGGAGNDELRHLTVFKNGNVYFTGVTSSLNAIASGGFQNTKSSSDDAFLVKINNLGVRQWGTYYGNGVYTAGFFCSVDNAENIYLAGATASLTGIASNGVQNSYGGGSYDAYCIKFDKNGTRKWGTYYGGAGHEYSGFCNADIFGYVYISGLTFSSNAIATGGFQNTYHFSDAFLVKIDGSNPILTIPQNTSPCSSINSSNVNAKSYNLPSSIVAYDKGINGGLNTVTSSLISYGPNMVYFDGNTTSISFVAGSPTPSCGAASTNTTPKQVFYQFVAPSMGNTAIEFKTNYAGTNSATVMQVFSGNVVPCPTIFTSIKCSNTGTLALTPADLSSYQGAKLYVLLTDDHAVSTGMSFVITQQAIAPSISIGTVTTSSLQVNLPASVPTGVSKYRLYWRVSGSTGGTYTDIASPGSSYTITSLSSGVNYDVWVAYYTSANNQIFMSEKVVGTTSAGCAAVPASPTAIKAPAPNTSCTKVLVTWPVHPLAGTTYKYRLYWRVSGSSGYSSIPLNDTFYTLSNLMLNTNYDIMYKIICGSGNVLSPAVTVHTTCATPKTGDDPTVDYSAPTIQGITYDLSDFGNYVNATEEDMKWNGVNDEYKPEYSQKGLININMYPNPTTELLYIDVDKTDDYKVVVYDIQGKAVISNMYANTNNMEMQMSHLHPGTYLIRIFSPELNESKKVVVIR